MGHLRLYGPEEIKSLLHFLGFEPKIIFTVMKLVYPSQLGKDGGDKTSEVRNEAHSIVKDYMSKLLRKYVRKPRDYCAAIYETSLEVLANRYPHLRPQMFIVAKKIKDADFSKNFQSEVQKIVSENKIY